MKVSRTTRAAAAVIFFTIIMQSVSLQVKADSSAVITSSAHTHAYEESLFAPFKGMRIREVRIEVLDIFDESEIAALYRAANAVKVNTRDEVVRRELLFKEGDTFDPFLVAESERLLRIIRFLRDVIITPVRVDASTVDIVIKVQDTWTLIPQVGYSSNSGSKRRSAGIAESNLFGLGKRVELLYEEDDKRSTTEAVIEDPRLMGTFHSLLLAYFDRSDGERSVVSIGRPIRSLLDTSAWSIFSDRSNSVGRLYQYGDERYIFRQKISELALRYTLSRGDPRSSLSRYSLGYDYSEARFFRADLNDYEQVNLNPDLVSNDPSLLAENRRFSGPVLTYQQVEPEFIQMNYIDRFDRVQDYNVGGEYSVNLQFAPVALGSLDDALLISGSKSRGYQFDPDSFIRGELGGATRYSEGVASDSILRFETKYYHVYGPQYVKGFFMGKHTLAMNFFIDYGRNLDRDREFLVGGDNVLRGYKARAFSGDKRFGFNVEDRMHFAEDVFQLVSVGGAAFLDVGGASYDSFGKLFSDEVYSNVGVGLRFAFPRSSGGSIIRADLAFPLRDAEDGSMRFDIRLVFAGGPLFSSTLRSESLGPEKANIAVGLER